MLRPVKPTLFGASPSKTQSISVLRAGRTTSREAWTGVFSSKWRERLIPELNRVAAAVEGFESPPVRQHPHGPPSVVPPGARGAGQGKGGRNGRVERGGAAHRDAAARAGVRARGWVCPSARLRRPTARERVSEDTTAIEMHGIRRR